jgi:hypothetical protein
VNFKNISTPLLDQIHSGQKIPIGWGCGKLFQLRHFIHDFEVAFTIHSQMQGIEIDSVSVKAPTILNTLDQSKYILIIYTIDFLDHVFHHCKLYPNLTYLPFNAAELGVAAKIQKLRAAADLFYPIGVSYGSISQYTDELGY